MTESTEAQKNYIEILRSGLVTELEKGCDATNFYLGHFMSKQRRAIHALSQGLPREERQAIKAQFKANQENAYRSWLDEVKSRLDTAAGLTKSEASTLINDLKNPSHILDVEYPV